jgi:hypothetical protein
MGDKKDFGRPSKEAMALFLSFVKHTVIPRYIAEQKAKKQQTEQSHEEEQQ